MSAVSMLWYDGGVNNRGKDGFEIVAETFRPALLRYAARLLNNVTLAQDAVQNALVKLARRNPPVEKPDDEVRNWLFRVTHNEAVDAIRTEERKRRALEHFAREQEGETDGGLCFGGGAADERETLVLSCLPTLSPLQRQVVLLRLQQGLSYEEIGEIVGEKSGYVGKLLHHAVKTLAAEVKRREGGQEHVST